MPCPYHDLKQHFITLTDMFAIDGELPVGLPLFPDQNGEPMTKDHFVEFVVQIAVACNLNTKASDGRNAFGGHVWRLSGARHLARIGVPLPIIKLIARWASNVIEHYLKVVPLERLTSAYKQGLGAIADTLMPILAAPKDGWQCAVPSAASSSSQLAGNVSDATLCVRDIVSAEVQSAMQGLEQQNRQLRSKVNNITLDIVTCRKSIALLVCRSLFPYICSAEGAGAYHVCIGDYQLTQPKFWGTLCGWRYGGSKFIRAHSLPQQVPRGRVCKWCVPDAVAAELGVQFDEGAT